MSARTWSSEQQAIFEYGQSGSGNVIVQARAGTGKTTTIIEMFKYAPENRILYAVFGKRNEREAVAKIDDRRVEVKTLHALGYQFIRRVWSNAKPDKNIERDRVIACYGIGIEDEPETVGQVLDLVGYAKNTCLNPTLAALDQICQERDIDFSGSRMGVNGVQLALDVLNLSRQRDSAGRISFNDMVWLPVAQNWVRNWFDLVVIDEAQDMNLPQLVMARQAVKAGGRVMVVGDDRQAIYGFRGAMQGGMKMMEMTLRARVHGLTTTYRCGRKIVELASEIVPDYHAAPGCHEGEILHLNEAKMLEQAKAGDAILSRLNAPLMPLALNLLRKNIPARIEGRDIGAQLVGMVKSMKARSVPNFIERVESWLQKQKDRLSKAKDADKKIETANDIAETLMALAEGAKSVNDIEVRINNLFQDTDEKSRPAVVLSSVHKAKGFEWGRVFMLEGTFRKGKGTEEDNIWYVAVTRAKNTLCFVGISSKDDAAAPPQAQSSPVLEVAKPLLGLVAPQLPLPVAVASPGTNCSRTDKLSDFDLPAGMVHHRVGNVIQHSRAEYVCTSVNSSCARFVRLGKITKVINHRVFGEDKIETKQTEVEDTGGKFQNLSAACDPADIIRRFTAAELETFLTNGSKAVKPAAVAKVEVSEQKPEQTEQTTNEENMKKQNKKSKSTTSNTERMSNAGRSDWIRSLKAKGTPKGEAFTLFGEKWKWATDNAKKYFSKVWDAYKPAGASPQPATTKPSTKPPTRKTKPARTAAAKPSEPPPGKQAAASAVPPVIPPPAAAPEPAAAPMPAGQ